MGPIRQFLQSNSKPLATATGGNGIYNTFGITARLEIPTGVGVGQYTVTVTSAGCTATDVVDIIPGIGVPEGISIYK